MVFHVSRGVRGRRLTEIALLRRDRDGYCHVVPAWQVDRGAGAADEALRQLIAERRAG